MFFHENAANKVPLHINMGIFKWILYVSFYISHAHWEHESARKRWSVHTQTHILLDTVFWTFSIANWAFSTINFTHKTQQNNEFSITLFSEWNIYYACLKSLKLSHVFFPVYFLLTLFWNKMFSYDTYPYIPEYGCIESLWLQRPR